MIVIRVGERILGNQPKNKDIGLLVEENYNANYNTIKTVYPQDVDPFYHVYSLYTKGCSRKDKNYLEKAIFEIDTYLKNNLLDEKTVIKIKKVEYKTLLALGYFNTKLNNLEKRKKEIKNELERKYKLSSEEIKNLENEVENFFDKKQKPVIFYRAVLN